MGERVMGERVMDDASGRAVLNGETIHATAVIAGEAGVLILGRSGAGKSRLARGIIESFHNAGEFARLVSDDRVVISQTHGRILARVCPPIAGLLEVRGWGLSHVPHEPVAVIDLLADFDVPAQRCPDICDIMTTLLNISIPRLSLGGVDDPCALLKWALSQQESLCMAPLWPKDDKNPS